MNAEEILEALKAKSKKKTIMIGDYLGYLEHHEDTSCITDHLLYKIWREVVYVHGNPNRYLIKPTEKDLEQLRFVFATYCQGNQFKLFPLFLEHVYSRFDEVCHYLRSEGYRLPFEPHMLGMFLYSITPILNWHDKEYTNEQSSSSY